MCRRAQSGESVAPNGRRADAAVRKAGERSGHSYAHRPGHAPSGGEARPSATTSTTADTIIANMDLVVEWTGLLSRFPGSLNALLRGLPESWTTRNEGGQSWSAHEVVTHLVKAELTNWIPRIRMARDHGESVVIPPQAWIGGLAAAVVIGALAGVLPAIRAARLSPTQALLTA